MNYKILNSLVHVGFNGPLMMYIGYTKPKHKFFYWLLLVLGILILIDLLYKLYTNNLRAWLVVHLVLFVPLFIYTGYLGISSKNIDYYYYSFLSAIGIAAFGYHLVKLLMLKSQ